MYHVEITLCFDKFWKAQRKQQECVCKLAHQGVVSHQSSRQIDCQMISSSYIKLTISHDHSMSGVQHRSPHTEMYGIFRYRGENLSGDVLNVRADIPHLIVTYWNAGPVN